MAHSTRFVFWRLLYIFLEVTGGYCTIDNRNSHKFNEIFTTRNVQLFLLAGVFGIFDNHLSQKHPTIIIFTETSHVWHKYGYLWLNVWANRFNTFALNRQSQISTAIVTNQFVIVNWKRNFLVKCELHCFHMMHMQSTLVWTHTKHQKLSYTNYYDLWRVSFFSHT